MMAKSALRIKIRAIPIIGYVLAWVHALVVLPRTRRTHGINIELLQQELDEIKSWKERVQTELAETDRFLKQTLIPRLENIEVLGIGARLERYDVLNIDERLARYDNLHLDERLARYENLQLDVRLTLYDSLQLDERLAHYDSLQLDERLARYDRLNIGERLERYDMLEIGKRLMQLDQLQLARQIKSIQQMMRDQTERGLQLETQLKNQHRETNEPEIVEIAAPKQKNLEDFYIDFEALFRGKRDDIKERLRVYLPYLNYIQTQAKQVHMKVVDVGCGRGEWLELLDEAGIPAMGVDLNAAMVDSCISSGLYAKCADAIQILEELPAGSVAAVTAFHLIEHLPFERMIALFDAAKAALCDGGVIIFETPNPENLKVGACNFYLDPTHLSPVVPQVAEFIAKQRGFKSAEILRLHPYPEQFLMRGSSDVADVINKEFFGPQDYALIAVK